MLTVANLSCSYGDRRVLDDVHLQASPGLTGLLGPNGSGKSTLIKCICGVLAGQGEVRFGGVDLRGASARDRARLLAYVPQAVGSRWPLRVFDAVLLGRRPYMGWRPSACDVRVVAGVLEELALDGFAARDLRELSGGERQKVLLARALAQEPRLLLLDEPTSALDVRHQVEVLQVVRAQVARRGLVALIAFHDLNLAAAHTEQLYLLGDGQVRAHGSPAEVLTAANLRAVYGVKARLTEVDGRPHVLAIEVPQRTIAPDTTLGTSHARGTP